MIIKKLQILYKYIFVVVFLNYKILKICLYKGFLRILFLLLELCFQTQPKTPLFLAIKLNMPDIVAFLLNQGAKVNIHDYWKQTPLSFTKNKELKKLLFYYYAIPISSIAIIEYY